MAATPPAPATGKPKVLAPTLVIFGAAFWAYVVLGEFVVTFDFPERLAVVLLLSVFALHCVLATARASYRGAFQRGLPGILAFGLWVFTLFASASLLGTSGRSRIEAVTLLLWFLAIAVYSIGRLLSDPRPATSPKLTWRSGQRWLKVGAWVISCGATAVALLSALDAQ